AGLRVTGDFVIYDTGDQEDLIKQALRELNVDDKKNRPASVLHKISTAKNELLAPQDYPSTSYASEVVRRVYVRYQELLAQNNALDFDDLLVETVRLLQERPDVLAKYQRAFEHVLVDEFQDTNTVQYTLLKLVSGSSRNLYCVGDPDQSIYKWRGADYRNVNKLREDYRDLRTILLEQNYRSTQLILNAAMAVIDKHPGRTKKKLRATDDRQGGAEIYVFEAYNEDEEARFIIETIQDLVRKRRYEAGDFAVMYRTNAQSRAVEDAFVRANMPYKLVGAQRFYGRKEIKDLTGYLRLIHNPADSVSLLRVINVPTRGIGAKTIEQLQAVAASAQLTPGDVVRDLGESGPKSIFAGHFGNKAAAALANFGLMFNHWLAARSELSVVQLIDAVLDRTGLRDTIRDGSDEGDERWANILELRGVAAADPDVTLADFLQNVALVSDQDTAPEEAQAPILLTLHAAKGLEFPVVFIVGLDEGVLPHSRSFDDPESMNEERRLMYVGMTRAKDQLYLLRAFRRSLYGDSSVSEPSRFLYDIPDTLLTGQKPNSQARAAATYNRMTAWDSPYAGRETSQPSSSGSGRGRAVTLSSAQMPQGQFRTGMRVKHASFGEGMVIESRGAGDTEEVTVAFEAVGVKRLMASLAKLKVVS
ncbi:MAG TPA: 3'-5' exonuclease, partial [Anaerolineales bacterium]|nr:3'-5' exonuclease [Anaerolineales bacterium]